MPLPRLWTLGLCLASLLPSLLPAAEPTVRFNRDIRPIMSDTCFRCHGPDAGTRMAKLRLDVREEALKPNRRGIAPIVPGAPDKSGIIQRIFAADQARIMPPVSAHKVLTAAQKDTIRRWVAEGAQYEGHWAYEPVRRPTPPAGTTALVRNPIDAFVQDRLRRDNLSPAPEAHRRTLLRRVTFDLTGVPPTPEETRAFLADTSADAYEKVVDRLLASPRHAEVQAMRWLDAVRYGDSAGFHGDNLWPAWPYRDYVLRAFRDNKPFDQFTREQIAGDLLPDGGVDAKVASAYNRLNRASAEGGLQPKEYLAKYGADRVRTASTVFLGATVGCAECHDHKFDPFTARDFYAMKAFFADIRETGLIPDRGAKAWGTTLSLPSDEQARRRQELTATIKAAERTLTEKLEIHNEQRWAWEARTLAGHRSGAMAWLYQRPLSASAANGTTLTAYGDEPVEFNYYIRGSLASERKPGDGLVVASGQAPDNDVYTVQLKPGAGTWTSLAIDIHQDEGLPGNRLSRGADRFVLTEVEADIAATGAAPARSLPFVLATTTGFGEPVELPAMAAIDGNAATGWGVSFGEHRNAFVALRFQQPVTTRPDEVITVRLRQESALRRATIGRFRLALSSARYSWPESGESSRKKAALKPGAETATLNVASDRGLSPEALKALEIDEADRTEEQQKLVLDLYAWSVPELQDLTIQAARLDAERRLLDAAIPRVIVTERMRPRVTRVLPRGNFLDDSGEIVEPAIPAFLGKLNTPGRRANRLDFANWIVSPDNPLTPRVQVNRVWRQFFGIGLSKVLEDLGSQGEWPTHPELLDWLAAEFVQPSATGAHPWDMRHLVRTVVTSHTYRQSSDSRPTLDERDPDNRLLARQSRFRVDAEMVHDTALSVAGLLTERFGGPSVRPYQPDGYLAALNFPKREYSASRGDDLYRRALYTQWQRAFLHPSLATFDAPSREECTVNRTSSNTPLQALVLLNDPIYVEAARVFAQNALQQGGTGFEQRLEWTFQRALNRAPDKEERRILSGLYRRSLTQFQRGGAANAEFLAMGEAPAAANTKAAELAAMTTVTRAVLNLHETITRN